MCHWDPYFYGWYIRMKVPFLSRFSLVSRRNALSPHPKSYTSCFHLEVGCGIAILGSSYLSPPQTPLCSIFGLFPLCIALPSIDYVSLLLGLLPFCDTLKFIWSMCFIFSPYQSKILFFPNIWTEEADQKLYLVCHLKA